MHNVSVQEQGWRPLPLKTMHVNIILGILSMISYYSYKVTNTWHEWGPYLWSLCLSSWQSLQVRRSQVSQNSFNGSCLWMSQKTGFCVEAPIASVNEQEDKFICVEFIYSGFCRRPWTVECPQKVFGHSSHTHMYIHVYKQNWTFKRTLQWKNAVATF